MDGFRLDGGGDTLVFLASARGAPRLAYWGPSLPPGDHTAALAALKPPAPQGGGLDDGEQLNWFPQRGEGFNGHPALEAHRDGSEVLVQWRIDDWTVEGARADVLLSDRRARLALWLRLDLDPETGVLAADASLNNDGEPLTVNWLAAAALPLPHAELVIFDGRWAREFSPVRQVLTTGLIAKENRTGRTSHHSPPFWLAGAAGFSEHEGEVFAAHLAWSGNHRIFAERLRDGRIQLQAGELLGPGESIIRTVQEGDAYQSPTLYLARSGRGLNGLSDRLHPFVRDRILGGRLRDKPRPVNYNTWEAVYFDHSLPVLKELADLAASVGAERYVLDDGWFVGRPNDRSGLGDWRVDPAKYPQGLTPLIEHVRGLGLQFGLWVEPEMANADSDLLRAHPDWIVGDPDREQPLGRHQYVLDLTRAEVFANIHGQLRALLAENRIDYLKWDMNRDLTHAVSRGRAATHEQTLAVYRLIDALRAEFPAVEIESCSSGGGRADYEILKRTDRIWTSDNNDPFDRQPIQRAFSIFFPPEVMGSHVGPQRAHTTGRSAGVGFRAATALMGHFGIEADLRQFSERDQAELADWIALYKAERHWLHAGRTVRLEMPDPAMIAQARIADDRALITAALIATPATQVPALLRIPGLANGSWVVEAVKPRRAAAPATSRGETVTAPAVMLAHAGLPLPQLRVGEAAVFLARRT